MAETVVAETSTGILLLAGAIGSVVTIGAAALLRLIAARLEIDSTDRRVQELDEDLERWVSDDHLRLKRALTAIRDNLSARNLFWSGQYYFEIGGAKERALQSYRDQQSRAERDRWRILEREGLAHAAWRRSLGRPQPKLTTPERAAAVLEVWRLPPSQHLGPDEEPTPLTDPTTRTLDETIEDAQVNPREFT